MQFRPAILILLASVSLKGVEPLPDAIANKASLSRTLPAPYSALMLVRLASTGSLSRAQKTQLAQEAYDIAVDPSIKPLAAYASLSENTAGEWLDRWDFKDLDAYSVAVGAYALYRDNYDKKDKALPAFPYRKVTEPVGCESMYVADPYDYYSKALKAGPNEFALAVRSIQSSIELGRAVSALLETSLNERNQLLASALMAMTTVRLSDREFGYAIRRTRMHAAILKYAEEFRGPAGGRLLLAYRAYLLRNFANTRCSDNYADYKGVITEFNKLAATMGSVNYQPLVPAIAMDEGRGKLVDSSTKFEANLTSPGAAALRSKINNLIMDETNITSVLREVDEYRPVEDLRPSAVILTKSYLYSRLFGKLKDTLYADRALRSWASYIAYGPAKVEAPTLWYACAMTLLDWSRDNPARKAEVEASGDPALAAFINLDPSPEAPDEGTPRPGPAKRAAAKVEP